MPFKKRKWEGTFEAYTKKFCNNNLWKVKDYEFLDLFHDCYILWRKLEKKYSYVIKDSDFMNIYMKSLRNMIIDYANKERIKNDIFLNHIDLDIQVLSSSSVVNCGKEAELNLAIFFAPKEVKDVLCVAESSEDILVNYTLCKELGYDREFTNLVEATRKYFS